MKVGEIERTFWYITPEGVFSFHTAFDARADRKSLKTTFRSPHDVWPSVTASTLGINYYFMRNATQEEINDWFADHPSVHLKDMQEVKVLVDEVLL